MATEVELKLRVAPEHAAGLFRHSAVRALAPGKPRSQKLYSIYYDTPELDLKRHGLTLRLRRVGGRWLQTIKGGGMVAAGLHQRDEWETELPKQGLDFTRLGDPALIELFGAAGLRDELRPVFETEFTRKSCLLEFPQGGQAEFALDRGEVRTDSAADAICEIELELKSGKPAGLFELALELNKAVPLKLQIPSKAERGYVLYSGTLDPPVKAGPVALEPSMTVNDAFRQIVWSCVSHLQANEAGLMKKLHPEYLHQMRVALRRLRSAFSVFSAVFPQPVFAPVIEEIKWLTSRLGPARDWDVFVTETLPAVCAGFPDHTGLKSLGQSCAALCATHDDIARQAVDSRRYQDIMLGLGAWLTAEPWMRQLDEPALSALAAPAGQFAPRVLGRRHRKLRKRGRQVASFGSPELHALRIAAKKQRYAAEFFAALYSGKESRAYAKALASAQDALGALNDDATAGRLLKEWAERETADADAEAAGLVAGWVACDAVHRMAQLKEAWNAFKKQKPFWEA